MPGERQCLMLLTLTGLVAGAVGLLHGWYRRKISREKKEALDKKREDQGNHECDVLGHSMPAQMESEANWNGCTKNPGHSKFIPAAEFSMSHLPETHRFQEMLDLIRNVSTRTVRLRVNYTSSARPQGFPFHNSGGKNITHVGTGWIRDIIVGHVHCSCLECKTKKTPATRTWFVRVHTACHVVFDTSEAKETLVDLFYDRDEHGCRNSERKTIKGLKVISKSEDQDLCKFYCVTHDEEFVKYLQKHMKKWGKPATSTHNATRWQENYAPFCIIVSHPHGFSKRITIGPWKGHTDQNEIGECALIYETDTCSGSSGAPCILPKRPNDDTSDWTPTIFPHSETLTNGLNQSAIGAVSCPAIF